MTVQAPTTWMDEAMDRAHDAGWYVHVGERQKAIQANVYGPRRTVTVYWARLVNKEGRFVGDEHTAASRDLAAFALVQSYWPGPETEETA